MFAEIFLGRNSHVVGISWSCTKKQQYGCARKQFFVAVTVTKIQKWLPFRNSSCWKLTQHIFSFYRELRSKEQASTCAAPSMGGVTAEGYRDVLQLQCPSTARTYLSVELFRATLAAHTHFEGINGYFEVILGNKQWAEMPQIALCL